MNQTSMPRTESKRQWTPSVDEEPCPQRKRHASNDHQTAQCTKKPSSIGGSKGLREYASLVHSKLQEKIHTSYNEVADELVRELLWSSKENSYQQNDGKDTGESAQSKANKMRKTTLEEKNIRRRVYDALNVLMAIGMITKDKKKITYVGLPSTSREYELEREHLVEEIERKKKRLQSLLVQNICFQNLYDRNQDQVNGNQKKQSEDSREHYYDEIEESKVHFPFVVLRTSPSATVHCFDMDRHHNRSKVINFNQPFEIHPDMLVFDRMGLHKTTHSKLQEMIPPKLLKYCEEHKFLEDILIRDTNQGVDASAGDKQTPIEEVEDAHHNHEDSYHYNKDPHHYHRDNYHYHRTDPSYCGGGHHYHGDTHSRPPMSPPSWPSTASQSDYRSSHYHYEENTLQHYHSGHSSDRSRRYGRPKYVRYDYHHQPPPPPHAMYYPNPMHTTSSSHRAMEKYPY